MKTIILATAWYIVSLAHNIPLFILAVLLTYVSLQLEAIRKGKP